MQIVCQGSLMYIDTRDVAIARHLLTEGVWEPLETELMKQSIKPHMIFVDIGANIGYYTLLAARLLNGTGKVVAIEPDLGNFRLLSLSVQANAYTNVIAVQKAVSNRTGRTRLFLDQKNIGIPSLSEDNITKKGGGSVYVNTVTLDSLLSDLKIEKVDVMKIDVEGAEGLVFEGGRKILHCVNRIFMEFKQQALRNMGTDPAKLTKQLIHAGFKISRIDEKNRRCVPVGHDYNSLLRLHEANLLLEIS
jgi:FkbM family methyltransferase